MRQLMISRKRASDLAVAYGSFCEAKAIHLAGNHDNDMVTSLHMLALTLKAAQVAADIEIIDPHQIDMLVMVLEAEMDATPITPITEMK